MVALLGVRMIFVKYYNFQYLTRVLLDGHPVKSRLTLASLSDSWFKSNYFLMQNSDCFPSTIMQNMSKHLSVFMKSENALLKINFVKCLILTLALQF